MSKLLRCPWCHKTSDDKDNDTRMVAVELVTFPRGDESAEYSVCCNWCGATGAIADTTDGALEGWVAEDHLQILEEKALRNLRDVVRAEIRERDRKTGFFDEAKAWTNIRNALSAC
ncbi:MAG TPA: hypothetical protein PKI68_01175 [Pontiellaceae bacterium]|nr:hypothetical protein [Pontiellaceae bacterium]